MPLRAALPTLTLLDMVPRDSTSPPAWQAAEPRAQQSCVFVSPKTLPMAMADPNTPQVEVMCQPLS
jgi:hypothetical protein